MGLDMYLTRRVWIGGWFKSRKVRGTIEIDTDDEHISVDPKKVSEIILHVGYWRKANQIHRWFVDYVQDGKDECGYSYVTMEQLKELKEKCERALTTRDASILPPRDGFFFGGEEIDDYYWNGIEETVSILFDLPEGDYYYHSSW